MTIEELEDVECYTAIVFWSNVKNSAQVIDYIKRFCDAKHVYLKRSLNRLWICENPDNTNPNNKKEEKQ